LEKPMQLYMKLLRESLEVVKAKQIVEIQEPRESYGQSLELTHSQENLPLQGSVPENVSHG